MNQDRFMKERDIMFEVDDSIQEEFTDDEWYEMMDAPPSLGDSATTTTGEK